MTLSARVVTGPQKADICGELGRVPTGRHTRPKAIRIRVAGVRVQQVCLGPGTGLVTRRGPAPRHGRISHITKVLPSHPPASPHRRFLPVLTGSIFLPPSTSPHRHRRAPMADTTLMDKLVSLCKRRGFIFQSSEIYGGTRLGVGLRSARRRAQEERQGPLVARDGPRPRRHRGARRRHPHAPARVGGERATSPASPTRSSIAGTARTAFAPTIRASRARPGTPDAQCPVCGSKGTLTEARLFNLMFKTFMGPVEEQASVVYLRPETAQGIYVNFLNVQQCTRQKDPVRHRADRQGVPQRDHARATSSSGRASSSRWRCSSSSSPAPTRSGSSTGSAWRMEWHHALGLTPAKLALAPARPGRAGPLRAGGVRRAVRLPVRLAGDRGDSQPRRLRPRPPPGVLGQEARVLRPGGERALPPVHRRDLGRRGPRHPHAPRERVSRGGGRGRGSRGPRSAPGGGADQGGRVSAGQEGRHARARHRALSRSQAPPSGLLRRQRRDRPALPPQDEVGTPFGITVDGETTEGRSVTVRHRDSMQQERVGLDQVAGFLAERIGGD